MVLLFFGGISFLVHEKREELLLKIVIGALASEIFKAMVMRSWPNINFTGHTGNFAFMAPSSMDKNIKISGLPWWPSGSDSRLPMQWAWAQSLVRKLDPTHHN